MIILNKMEYKKNMRNNLIIKTKDNKKVLITLDVVASLFADDQNKQDCFKKFLKENQLRWCNDNLQYNDIKDKEHKLLEGIS